MPDQSNPAEHRAMAWAALGEAAVAIGATTGVGLAIWSATTHLWSDDYFLAGFAASCGLTAVGVYVLIAEFIGGVGPIKFPLPLTRREREAKRQARRSRRVTPSHVAGPWGQRQRLAPQPYLPTRGRPRPASQTPKVSVPKQPVSDAHRDMLKEVARTLRSYVDASQHAYYGARGDERKAHAFQEHFPDMACRVTAWNEQIAALEAERRELQEWVEERLRALAYDQPPFAWGYGGLIAEYAAGDGAELPFHAPQIEPPWLHLGSWPLVPDPPPNGRTREGIEDELRGVLSEARRRPQRERSRQIRGLLAEASEPLISDLDLIQAKDVINGLGDCVLCR